MSQPRALGRRMLLIMLLGLLPVQAGSSSAAEAAGYKLVVNSQNPASALPRKQVSAMFLKKVTAWEHGGKVAPVDLGADSPVREIFTKDVHGKTVAAVKGYWQQLIFSGRGVPPPEKSSDAEVIAFVKASPGAVGYVSLQQATADVKVVRVEP